MKRLGFLLFLLLSTSPAFAQLRIDQLTGVGSITDSDIFPDCQGCGAASNAKSATGTQMYTYIEGKMAAGNHVWTGSNATTPLALTPGATVTPTFAGSVDLTLTLGQNSFIACPSAGQTAGQKPVFYFTQGTGSGSGGFQPTWDTCYGFPNHQPPLLTADTDGAKDMVGCAVLAASGLESIWCGTQQNQIGYGLQLRNNHASASCSSSTTCTITVSNVVAGDLVVLGLMESGSASNPASGNFVSAADAHGNSCTRATGTFKTYAGGARATSVAYCPVTNSVASGDVWTVTWTPTELFTAVHFAEFVGGAGSPDIGVGNGGNGTSTTPTVTATGADTQPFQLVFAMAKADGGGTISAGAGFTLLDTQAQGSNPSADEYRLLSTGTATATVGLTSSVPYAISTAVFAHQ
jgi:hypothetical protein